MLGLELGLRCGRVMAIARYAASKYHCAAITADKRPRMQQRTGPLHNVQQRGQIV